MAQVFISYKSEEVKFALQIKKRIESFGYDVWIDKELLRPGEDWREDIDLGIETSFAMVVIISKNALESKYMMYEFAYAKALRKQVIPIIYDEGIEASDFHPRLEGVQHIPFVKADEIDEGYVQLSRELNRTGKVENMTVSLSKYPVFIQKVIDDLENSLDSNERERILNRLMANKHPKVNEFLAELSEGYYWQDIPPLAARRLAERSQNQDERAITGLISGLKHGHNREICTKTLVAYGEKALSQLLPILDSEHTQAIKHVMEIIGNLDAKQYSQKIVKLARQHESLRETAIIVLTQMKSVDAAPMLLDSLKSFVNGENRKISLSRLLKPIGILQVEEAIPDLISLLKDEGYSRFWDDILNILKQIGDIDFRYIRPFLESEDELQNINGAKLLQITPNSKAIETLAALTPSDSKKLDLEVVKAIGEIGSKEAILKLLSLLEHEYKNIIWVSLLYLGDHKPAFALPSFNRILENADQEDMFKILLTIRAMITIANDDSVELIVNFLDLDNIIEFWWKDVLYKTSCQAQAIIALESIETPEALEALAEWRKTQNMNEP